MKIEFKVGTKGRASFFFAKFFNIGRYNVHCEQLGKVVARAMQETFRIGAEEAGITDEQMNLAKEVAEKSPIKVILDISLVKDMIQCRVTYRIEDTPVDATRKQQNVGFRVANVICEYLSDYKQKAKNGEIDKQYKKIVVIKELPKMEVGSDF